MAVIEIKNGIYSVGAMDWDRQLFDELIPLPDGTSYNAYLIKGNQKTALIDTVDPSKEHELIGNLKSLGVSKIDFIIANHAEQDHSGAIPRMLELYPDAVVVTNLKCKTMLIDLLRIPEDRFIVVEDGDTLSLGDKTLQFILAPWVHWPETMFTYLKEDRILFTCDFLGSHLATNEIYAEDQIKLYLAAKRYYAEIMMPFKVFVQKHLKRINGLPVNIVAPSHGPIYKNPGFIINAYNEWVSDRVKNEVLILYVSMHGSTARMVEYIVNALTESSIPVKLYNLTKTDMGELAMALVDASTVILASPTVLAGPHPSAVYAAYLINALRPNTRYVSIVGSYGWGSKVAEQLRNMLSNLKADFIEPVIVKGYPKEGDLKLLDRLVDDIITKHNMLKEGL